MTSNLVRAKYSGSQRWESVSMMVRLLRSMTWQPQSRARLDEIAKCSLNSARAAGEVKPTPGRCLDHSPTRSATGADIISVRHGAAST